MIGLSLILRERKPSSPLDTISGPTVLSTVLVFSTLALGIEKMFLNLDHLFAPEASFGKELANLLF
jgi:hypothetical protein